MEMKRLPLLFCTVLAAVGATAGSAAAHCRPHHAAYVTRYERQTRYVRRTVVVPVRVWRPVRERVVYAPPVYRREVYAADYAPAYGPDYAWSESYGPVREGGWRHGWRERHCHHGRWDGD